MTESLRIESADGHTLTEVLREASSWSDDKRSELQSVLAGMFLGAIPKTPITVWPRESPDFSICFEGRTVGLEHTFAASQPWEEAEALLGRGRAPYTTVARPDVDGQAVGRALHSRLRTIKPTSVWSSHDHAQAKLDEVAKAITKKEAVASRPNFETFDENWLLIVDKCPFLFLDIDLFAQGRFVEAGHFDRVYLLTERHESGESISYLWEVAAGRAKVINSGVLPEALRANT